MDIFNCSDSINDAKNWWDNSFGEQDRGSKGRFETPNSRSKITYSMKSSLINNQTFTLSQFMMPIPKVQWKIKQYRRPFQASNEFRNPFRKMVSFHRFLYLIK